MKALLYHPIARTSAKRLAQWMGLTALTRLSPTAERLTHLIRYGSGKQIPLRPVVSALNPRASLVRYSNRFQQLTLLHRAGVGVPHFTNPRVQLPTRPEEYLYRRYPTNGRQLTGGEGIVLNPENPGTYDLAIHLVPKHRQFRVHVIGSRTRVRELVPDVTENKRNLVWNLDNGFTYRTPLSPVPPRVPTQAVAAIAALRLDFGAVDIVLTDLDISMVLEVNTAPGLCDSTLEWYGTNLGRLIGLTPDEMPQTMETPDE